MYDEINNYNLKKLNNPIYKKKDLAVKYSLVLHLIGQKAADFSRDAFQLIRRIEAFCECATVGSAKHIELMKQIIEEDPKK